MIFFRQGTGKKDLALVISNKTWRFFSMQYQGKITIETVKYPNSIALLLGREYGFFYFYGLLCPWPGGG
ncbi:MAG: hypothetical protein DRG76_10980 [Deltaproteobacteria bacterium]|nr:MAG: hypothetical protein DRG76_10980 [Deltaproteobacteria bacterium]